MRDGDGVRWPRDVPELTTTRLLLRAVDPARDATAILRLLSDPEATRYMSAPACTMVAEARAALERFFSLLATDVAGHAGVATQR
jgi:RimJ/RimL family protein N-acetyltransferase